MKITKRKMFFKYLRLILYRIRKRTWFLPAISEITVDHLFDRINSNLPPLLIDVRVEKDFNGDGQYKYEKYGHIPNAKSIPIMELSPDLEDLQPFKEKEIVTICQGGGMSLIAVEILIDADFKDVKSLTGGIVEWHKNGYPLTTE